jgi:hypothetical protein
MHERRSHVGLHCEPRSLWVYEKVRKPPTSGLLTIPW